MAGTPDKGNFSTSIGQDVIEEALRAVQKRSGHGAEAGEEGEALDLAPEVEPAAEPAGEAASPAAAPAAEEDPLRKEMEQLRAQLEFSQAKGRELMEKLKETHEKMLRAAADLENFKRRAQKEKEEIQKFGVERLLKDLLAVPDNLDRALEHARSPADFDSLKTGLQMTRKLFDDTLARHGVRSFSAVGQAFDPRFHEAMQHVEVADLPPGQVAGEMLRGYMLHDRLVRPALVTVSKGPPPAVAPEAAVAEEETAPEEVAAGGGEVGSPGQK